jgi:hypothetical protein
VLYVAVGLGHMAPLSLGSNQRASCCVT